MKSISLSALGRCLVPWVAILSVSSACAFRCNTYVIDPGLRKAEVIKKCGTPTSQDTRIERRILRVRNGNYGGPANSGSVEVEREVQITIEEWIYNFGPNEFMQLVVFENGRVTETKDLGYGR